MLQQNDQHQLLQQLFDLYANSATSKAKLSLSLNSTMSTLDQLQGTIDEDLLNLIRGSMIDLYDKKFSIRYFFYPAHKLIDQAKSTFLLRLLNLNNN